MAELVSQQSSSPVYRAACELAAYRLREALADKPFIEYDKTEPGELLQWPLPGDPVASITVASAVDGSQATMYLRNDAMVLDNAPKTFPWLKRCGLEPGWSRPYTDPDTQQVVISFVAPLVRDGKVVAAVAAGSIAVGARGTTGKKRPAAPAFLAVTEPRLRSRLLLLRRRRGGLAVLRQGERAEHGEGEREDEGGALHGGPFVGSRR